MGDIPKNELSCWEIDEKGLIVKLLDHKLSSEEEDDLLFHIRHCTNCLAVVADVLFARSHLQEPGPGGKDYRININ